MIKKMVTHGNSAALIIDKPILQLLKIDENAPLELTTDGSNLIISPIDDERRERKFKSALERVNKKHGKHYKNWQSKTNEGNYIFDTFRGRRYTCRSNCTIWWFRWLRDINVLSTAIAMPLVSFSGGYLHDDIIEMAAAYTFHICQNHPFVGTPDPETARRERVETQSLIFGLVSHLNL